MPAFDRAEAQRLVPFFKTKFGRLVMEAAFGIVGIDRFNRVYDTCAEHATGPDFARDLLALKRGRILVGNIAGLDQIPSEGSFIVIGNHSMGGTDGVMMIDMIGHIRPDLKVMVNQILTYLRALDENFIAVNPTGTERTVPTAQSLKGVKASLLHIREGHPLGIFPSGAVSDLSLKDRSIRDREWQEAAIRLIKKARVPVLPLHFECLNTRFYYLLGLIDWKVRLARLPREIVYTYRKPTDLKVNVGRMITPEEQDAFTDIGAFRDFLRSSVYDMPPAADWTYLLDRNK